MSSSYDWCLRCNLIYSLTQASQRCKEERGMDKGGGRERSARVLAFHYERCGVPCSPVALGIMENVVNAPYVSHIGFRAVN